jgi:hypothetical protein
MDFCEIFVKYLYESRKRIKYSISFWMFSNWFFFVIFVYQIIILTIDYLSFPHSVKLDIIDEKQVLPAITICSKSYLSTLSINTYFNITDEVSKQEKYHLYENNFTEIFNEFSVDKKLELSISAKNLFNFSAKLHDSKNLERKLLSDCEKYIRK